MTEEGLRQLGNDIYDKADLSRFRTVERIHFVELGRGASEILRPRIIDETLDQVVRELVDGEYGLPDVARVFLARKVRETLLPTPIDPAVASVKKIVERLYPQGNYNISDAIRTENVKSIVAAVREADKVSE